VTSLGAAQSQLETTPRQFGLVAVARPLRKPFLYQIPEPMQSQLHPGMRVEVPFGRSVALGFFLAFSDRNDSGSDAPLKPIVRLLDGFVAVPDDVMSLVRFASVHYRAPLGEALKATLPPGLTSLEASAEVEADSVAWWAVEGDIEIESLRRTPAQQALVSYLLAVGGRAIAAEVAHAVEGAKASAKKLMQRGLLRVESVAVSAFSPHGFSADPVVLTDEQSAAVASLNMALSSNAFRPVLLHGVTGSGKTEVYLRLVESAMEQGKGALVLVPEIALTPQLVGRFHSRFGAQVVVLHSSLKDKQRLRNWQQLRRGDVRIAVGVRSAVFAPVPDLGLIIVDEEHEPSFKQEEKLRYHARDLAVVRANHRRCTVVLGSATPSFETLENVRRGKYQRLVLSRRVDARPLPTIELIDLRIERPKGEPSGGEEAPILSAPLLRAVGETIDAGQQSILFLNRRGHSPFLICEVCGTSVKCGDCDVCLTAHRSQRRLQCHYCGRTEFIRTECASCGGRVLQLGFGTERVEEEVRAAFPRARVARLDRDAVTHLDDLTAILSGFARREIDVLVGTQMVAKGHDFPGVTLVAVVLADGGLSLPDFRAAERSVQLLTQVAGRAGRGRQPGRVLIQTYMPTAAPIEAVLRGDFDRFAENELKRRQALQWPPVARLVAVRIEGRDAAATALAAQQLGKVAEGVIVNGRRGVRLLGPALAPVSKVKGLTRWQLMLKAATHAELFVVLDAVETAAANLDRSIRVVVDVDPGALL
jgi:primosomal protein N' (replication factor Y) (superfamily II helicase)